MMLNKRESVVVGGVKLFLEWPEGVEIDPGNAIPVVFLVHGREGNHQDVEAIAKRFAREGQVLACYGDVMNHGSRLVEKVRNEGWKTNKSHAMDMYVQMVETVKELEVQIEFLPGLLGVKWSKTCIFGISQGGHAALLAMTNLEIVDVCISVISSGNYHRLMEIRYKNCTDADTDGAGFGDLYPDTFANVVELYDPIKNVDRLVKGNRPILILNGQADQLVPLECNLGLWNEIYPRYEAENCSNRLKHFIQEGVKHKTTPEMVDESLCWIQQWMSPKSSI